MTPAERYKRAAEVFEEICDVPAEKRFAVLDKACGSDMDLRREVESLLKHDAQSGETILLHEFSSPQFASIEMHETSIRDGVARMQRIGPITVDTDASVEFAPGARHLMLIDPLRGLIPGAVVAIEIHYDNGGLLIVEAPLTTRHPAANDN